MERTDYARVFEALTGNRPFPWQWDLYDSWFRHGQAPTSCNLPTGLGKTSVIAVWLIALANGAKVPRRLVYVVNRRTVVDQTTEEVEKYRENIEEKPELVGVKSYLGELLRISTLRGQFADNREWSADPSRPAVICGTVDMIGSRLLFSGYGIGWKSKPLHAGFLGQDALLVHDEAHLEPAFQTLIGKIQEEQSREPEVMWPKFRVMELTATSRGEGEVFGLSEDDRKNVVVQQRVNANKAIRLHEQKDKAKLAEQLSELALGFKDSGKAILVFAFGVDDVLKVRDKLAAAKLPVVTLTGTMRGHERETLIEEEVFRRFLPGATSGGKTVYLVCTSAGEVGVNISADHLICDLSTFESMAQRFGRVNRFGLFDECKVHIVHPVGTMWDDKHPLTEPRKKTLDLLRQLNGDGSPAALGDLPLDQRVNAFAPEPTILPATDILFDAWALTTITGKLPGRPKVEPYLHGLSGWELPETQVAWREEVEEITGVMLEEYKPKSLLEGYPLKPHELLREPSHRAFRHFEAMAKRLAGTDVPIWLVDDDGEVEVLTLAKLADKDEKDRISGKTVLLPPSAGGLSGGMLDGTAAAPDSGSLDIADEYRQKGADGQVVRQRRRLWNVDPKDIDPEVADMHSILEIELPSADDDAERETWEWFVLRNEGEKSAKDPVEWGVHVADVERHAAAIVDNLPIGDTLREVVKLAAKYHDHGKRRKLFQRILGNADPKIALAKSGKKGGRVKERYRHEFGSLVDVLRQNLLDAVALADPDWKELVLHLIAAHHGRARPHFPADEAFDPDGHTPIAERIARETPRRFARLQRKYGRWGLAYLESLLRAADWAASGNPSAYLTKEEPK